MKLYRLTARGRKQLTVEQNRWQAVAREGESESGPRPGFLPEEAVRNGAKLAPLLSAASGPDPLASTPSGG